MRKKQLPQNPPATSSNDNLTNPDDPTLAKPNKTEFYRDIAAKSALIRQNSVATRNQAMLEMLHDGWKIPTLIQLTMNDLVRLQRYLSRNLGRYLGERPPTDCPYLFVSRSGKALDLANTYNLLRKLQSEHTETIIINIDN